ncbi:hypothetical protein [Streptomyces sp. NPDC045251]|uniref:hypothetical protein n=1 Tax=unclassified Streptomyces TaxID=2593676 RepID=UPI0033F286AE
MSRRPADLSFFQSETAQRLRAEGRAEGLAEGRAEGLAEGLAEGRAEGILLVLDRHGVEMSEEERARIAGCTDMAVLDVWFTRAIAATSAAEVFAAEGD